MESQEGDRERPKGEEDQSWPDLTPTPQECAFCREGLAQSSTPLPSPVSFTPVAMMTAAMHMPGLCFPWPGLRGGVCQDLL